MRLLNPLAVFVVAILTLQVRTTAEDAAPDVSKSVQTVSASSAAVQQYGSNGFDHFRHEPDLGAGSSPSHGFKHFPFGMHMFTTWHRPKASTLTKYQRCAPDAFRPRGYGHLFARPCDSFRMDYSPYTLSDGYSQYGPSYYYRQPDQRCDDCDHHHKYR